MSGPDRGTTGDRDGFLGLDIGTTNVKVLVITADGAVADVRERAHQLHQETSTRQEIDPAEIIANVCALVSAAAAACAERGVRIASLSCSILGEAFVLLDEAGRCLGRSPVAMDQRGLGTLPWFRDHFGEAALYARTGQPLHPMYTATKLAWWRETRPREYDQVAKVLDWQAYLTTWMCGRAVTDPSLATRLLLYDVTSGDWWPAMLEALALRPEQLPTVQDAGSVAGALLPGAAAQLGLAPGLPVVVGAWDQACAAVAGAVREGVLMDSLGTTQALIVQAPNDLEPAAFMANGYQVTPAAVAGERVVIGGSLSGALILRWLRDQVGGFDGPAFEGLMGGLRLEPATPLVLPHLTGAGTPRFDPRSMAAVVGATFHTTMLDLLEAALDGLAYEARTNIETLAGLGVPIERVHVTGGLTSLGPSVQRKADAYGMPVARLRNPHGSTLGAAILAVRGSSAADEHEREALVTDLTQPDVPYLPDPRRAARHDARYALHQRLYPALQPIFAGLHELGTDPAATP